MKITKFITIVFSIFFSLSLDLPEFSSASAPDRERYEDLLNQVNEELSQTSRFSSCPGTSLMLTCGNQKCEPELEETERSCPSDCLVAQVRSYNSETFCNQVKEVLHPKTPQEVQSIVKRAVSAKEHVRVIGNAHTTNSQLCTNGRIISTDKLNHIVGLDTFQGEESVIVQPGVLLSELTEWLHRHHRSLGYAVIGFRGVTIGGAIATGAHGSSPHHSSVISSLVQSLTLVKADGKLIELSEQNTEPDTFRALRANLGMLGAVVEIRLRIGPQFNLHVQVTYGRDNKLLAQNGLLSQVAKCDYGQVHWFPQARRYIKTCGVETQEISYRGANNTLLSPPIPNFITRPVSLVLQYGACHKKLNVLLEKLRYLSMKVLPPLERSDFANNPVPTTDVTGPSHRMMSSVFNQYSQSMYVSDWEIAIPLSYAQAALKDIQNILLSSNTALPLTGIFIRFVPSEGTTLLAHSVASGNFPSGEPAVLIEFPTFRPIGFPKGLFASYFKPYEQLIKLLIGKYHGRAHLGKAQEWVFELENQRGNYGNHLARFQKVMKKLDPNGVFSNDFNQIIRPRSSPPETLLK